MLKDQFVLYAILRIYLCNRQLMIFQMQSNQFSFLFRIMFVYSFLVLLAITSWHYSGFGTKLSPFFGLAKLSQIQDQLPIKPNAQIRCSGCYGPVFCQNYEFPQSFHASFRSFLRFNFYASTFRFLRFNFPPLARALCH